MSRVDCDQVMESKVCLSRKLQEVVFSPENLARLREELRRQAEEPQKTQPVETARLQTQIAALHKKIHQGMERMALIDAHDFSNHHRLRPAEVPKFGSLSASWSQMIPRRNGTEP